MKKLKQIRQKSKEIKNKIDELNIKDDYAQKFIEI